MRGRRRKAVDVAETRRRLRRTDGGEGGGAARTRGTTTMRMMATGENVMEIWAEKVIVTGSEKAVERDWEKVWGEEIAESGARKVVRGSIGRG